MEKAMRKFLSVISLVLVLTFTLACFTACKDETVEGTEPEKSGFDISEYKIVRSTKAGEDLTAASAALKNKIKNNAGVELALEDDWYAEGTDVSANKEILIGNTNRVETVALQTKLGEIKNELAYAVEVSGNKIVILGKSELATIHAIKYFVSEFVYTSAGDGTITIDANFSKAQVGNKKMTIYPETLVGFTVGKEYVIYEPEQGKTATLTNQYPTAIYLQYQQNPENNGVILATFNSSEEFYRIFRSDDDGQRQRPRSEDRL